MLMRCVCLTFNIGWSGVFIDAQFFLDPVMILGELEVMADKLNALSNLARTYAEYQVRHISKTHAHMH